MSLQKYTNHIQDDQTGKRVAFVSVDAGNRAGHMRQLLRQFDTILRPTCVACRFTAKKGVEIHDDSKEQNVFLF